MCTYIFFRQMLFEQEDSNLYAEPVIVAKMVFEHFKVDNSFIYHHVQCFLYTKIHVQTFF